MSKKDSNTGRFVWHELLTRDLGRALDFYRPLVGWTVEEQDMGEMGIYHTLKAGERGVAGAMSMPDDAESSPHWLGYCGVKDVDTAVEAASESAATIFVPPRSIPGVGRMSVFADPAGAVVAAFKGESEMPLPSAEDFGTGDFCWWELVTKDIDGAKSFYAKVFGWTSKEMEMGGQPYYVFEMDEESRAGMMAPPEGYDGPAFWLLYTLVDDVDAKAEEVVSLGGKVISPASEVAGMGRMIVLQDPTGAQLALFSGEDSTSEAPTG